MKRFNYSSMLAIAILAPALLAGCGKKNTVGATNTTSTAPVQPGVVQPNGTIGFGQYATQVQQLKSQVPCYSNNGQPGQRLNTVITFSKPGASFNGSNTTITGPFQQGVMSGTVSGVYVGKSYWNDLIIVSKVTNGGSQIIGWNITLAMCSMSTPMGFPLISDQRVLSNFQAPQGITIAEATGCGYGSVLSAQNTYMVSAPFQNYPQFDVYTSFAPMTCNGGQYQQQGQAPYQYPTYQ